MSLPAVGADVDGELLGTWYHGEGSMVVFAHGSGSSRRSTRNVAVAEHLHRAGFATLLVDLLTVEEQRADDETRQWRFDIELLTRRVVGALDWLGDRESAVTRGLLGASTGAAAALGAAVRRPDDVGAVVSRGGRPDLSPDALASVRAPTVFIVGGADEEVLALNQQADRALTVEHELAIVPGATHLFEEPGALEQVTDIATAWFRSHLR
ncbi:dienelactone hydrolase family protein [Allosaccharopolyspora coralli]|nr:dienelactone hydrolase family protein [Allosaccharopolyspora coralli]